MSSSDNTLLCGVSSHNIDGVWNEILPMLHKTLEYCDNKYNVETIYNCLRNKEMQLWIAYQGGNINTEDNKILAYMITQIVQYPTQKRLVNLFVGGSKIFRWIHFLGKIKEWAQYQGCNAIEGFGRPGWERVLEKYGYKKIHTIYKLEI